jgi:hypothetical protein
MSFSRIVAATVILTALLACGGPSAENGLSDVGGAPADGSDFSTQEPDRTVGEPAGELPRTDAGAARQEEPEGSAADWTAGIVERERTVAAIATQTAARVARNDGFDRLALEFAGDELPSYHVEYVDRPIVQCGSGDVVPIDGDAWLRIRFEPAQAHNEEGRATVQQRNLRPGLPVVLEARLICDFEAQVEWVLGVASPNRYRVLELTNPTRLVIDVQH